MLIIKNISLSLQKILNKTTMKKKEIINYINGLIRYLNSGEAHSLSFLDAIRIGTEIETFKKILHEKN